MGPKERPMKGPIHIYFPRDFALLSSTFRIVYKWDDFEGIYVSDTLITPHGKYEITHADSEKIVAKLIDVD